MKQSSGQEPRFPRLIRQLTWSMLGLLLACSSAFSAEVNWACQPQTTDQEPVVENGQDLHEQIVSLIAQLGDADFYVRENAEKELLNIGRPAIESVQASRLDSDVEVRLRSQRLLKGLKRADFQQKLADFLNGKSGSDSLPAWDVFSKITGAERSARELFAAIYAKSPELFQALADNDRDTAKVYYDRLSLEIERVQMRSVNVCSLLFADAWQFSPNSDGGTDEEGATRIWSTPQELAKTSHELTSSYMVGFKNASGFKIEINALLSHWIKLLPDDELMLNAAKIRIIERHQLVELLSMVADVALEEGETPRAKARAIVILAELGNESEIERLQPLLLAKEVIGRFQIESPNKEWIEVQLRDLALAATVYLSGQTLKDYGFDHVPKQSGGFISISQAGFDSELEREKALDKWNQFYRTSSDGNQ